MRIALFSNDVVPDMGLPVAAPGLRVWGLAAGLRAAGHDVTVLVDIRIAQRAWGARPRHLPPPTPPGGVLIRPSEVSQWVATHGVDALVVTNSNIIGALGDLGRCRLVYDFFAPKVLELAEQAPPDELDAQIARLGEAKIAGLRRSDAVIVNGAKKLPYVAEWLARAGRPELPVRVVNMCLPLVDPDPVADGRVHAIVSGYLQPWSKIGPWLTVMRPFLQEGSMMLHVLLGAHWGQSDRIELPRELKEAQVADALIRHDTLRFDDFRTLMARCHLNVDLFRHNPERELAMVTRSITALTCGVPTVHVPFTEVSPLIAQYDAGWLVDEADRSGMRQVFTEALDADVLAARRDGARRLGAEVLAPEVATAPLGALLEEICNA